jgi:Zn-finger nucleic acid-binding protein
MTLRPWEIRGPGILVDFCSACAGVWFDPGEIDRALGDLAERRLRVPHTGRASELECPACGAFMRTFPYPRTYASIDMCPACEGIWLDGGELREISVVRAQLRAEGEITPDDAPRSIKQALLGYINGAIDQLTDFSED